LAQASTKHISTAAFLLRRKYQAVLEKAAEGRTEQVELARLKQLDFQDSEMPIFDEALRHVSEDGSLKHFTDAFSKETDRRKQQGFYVDLGKDLSIRSTPLNVTREQAQAQLNFVQNALRALSAAFDDPKE
jgi:hypothetical protein